MKENEIIHAIEYLKIQAQEAIEALKRLRRDIEEEKARLQELHEITASADSLGALIAKHEAEKNAFANEIRFLKQTWEFERKAINRARELDDAEYRQRTELARQKDLTERSRLMGGPLHINHLPIVRRVRLARIRSNNGTSKIERS